MCRQYFACPKRSITFSPGLLSRMQNITLDIYEQHRAPQLCSTAVGKCQMLKQTHLPDSEAAELESRLFFHVFFRQFQSVLHTQKGICSSYFTVSSLQVFGLRRVPLGDWNPQAWALKASGCEAPPTQESRQGSKP